MTEKGFPRCGHFAVLQGEASSLMCPVRLRWGDRHQHPDFPEMGTCPRNQVEVRVGPTCIDLLEGRVFLRMIHADVLTESDDGRPIADVQNELVVSRHDGLSVGAGRCSPRDAPDPKRCMNSKTKQGKLHPTRESFACRRQRDTGVASLPDVNRAIRIVEAAEIGGQVGGWSIEQDSGELQAVGFGRERYAEFREEGRHEAATEADRRRAQRRLGSEVRPSAEQALDKLRVDPNDHRIGIAEADRDAVPGPPLDATIPRNQSCEVGQVLVDPLR